MNHAELQAIVNENMDNALDNAPEFIKTASNLAIAEDMLEYCADFEFLDLSPDDLVPFIETWWNKV